MEKVKKIRYEIKNKIKYNCIILICFMLFFIFSTIYVKAVDNVVIQELETTYRGTIVKVECPKKMMSLKMYMRDKNNEWSVFFKDNAVNENSKNYFVSAARLSTEEEKKIKVIVTLEDGSLMSSELSMSKIPELPVPVESTLPSVTPSEPLKTPTNNPSNTPTSDSTPDQTSNQNTNPENTTAVENITLNKTSVTLYTNGANTVTLKPTITPKKSSSVLTWSTSNKKVATVDKNGKVTAVAKGTATITVKTQNGKNAKCKVTVKTLSKINKTLSTSNCKKVAAVTAKVSGCTSSQSLCVTDKYYVCALKNGGDTKQVLQIYNKNGKYIKKFVYTDLRHVNGMTYNPNNDLIYLSPLKGGQYYTFKASTISSNSLKRGSGTLKYSISGITYDIFKNEYYTKSGPTIRRYDSNMKYKNTFKVYKYTIGQDVGCYKGLVLAINYVGSGNADIYIHRASNGEYLGKYHVSLPGELESVTYDQYNKNFALLVNTSSTDVLYTTTAINLDAYCR